ncbi:unnamed protein product [Eretmochelys imbricata]
MEEPSCGLNRYKVGRPLAGRTRSFPAAKPAGGLRAKGCWQEAVGRPLPVNAQRLLRETSNIPSPNTPPRGGNDRRSWPGTLGRGAAAQNRRLPPPRSVRERAVGGRFVRRDPATLAGQDERHAALPVPRGPCPARPSGLRRPRAPHRPVPALPSAAPAVRRAGQRAADSPRGATGKRPCGQREGEQCGSGAAGITSGLPWGRIPPWEELQLQS